MAGSLEDRQDIFDVLVRYATGIDRRDWSLLRTCFTPDVRADYGEAIGRWDDLDAFTEYMRVMHQDIGPSEHMLSNFVIDVDGDTADTTTYVHAVLVLSVEPHQSVDIVGRYEDRFVRTADGWRIAERTFHEARMLMTPPPAG